MNYPYSDAVPNDDIFEKRFAFPSGPSEMDLANVGNCTNAGCPNLRVKFGRCEQCLLRAFGPNWRTAKLFFGDRKPTTPRRKVY
jgi:hypothetical protein